MSAAGWTVPADLEARGAARITTPHITAAAVNAAAKVRFTPSTVARRRQRMAGIGPKCVSYRPTNASHVNA